MEKLHFAIQRRLLPNFAGVLSSVLGTPPDDVVAHSESTPTGVRCGRVLACRHEELLPLIDPGIMPMYGARASKHASVAPW